MIKYHARKFLFEMCGVESLLTMIDFDGQSKLSDLRK